MPTTFSKADEEVVKLFNSVMDEYHSDLAECGLQLGVLMAYNPKGDAVKHGGYPALATVKAVAQRDRITKDYDVEILVDEDRFTELSPEQKVALIDHELSHVRRVANTPKAIAAGELAWKTDDNGRPKVKIVKADGQPSDFFVSVLERHGTKAVEWQSIQSANLAVSAAVKVAEVGDEDKEAA